MNNLLPTWFVTAGMIASSPIATAGDLDITVNKVAIAEGSVLVAVYRSRAEFRKKILVGQSKPAQIGKMQFSVQNLPAGEYAVMVFHDINENGKLDKRLLFGIPKEPWGGSMNGNNYIGPPWWSNVNFNLPVEGKEITIEMN